MTHLSTFRKESSFTTWVFRIAANHLQNYKKHMFSKYPLSFESYGADIASGKEADIPDLSQGVDRAILEQELKLACTNVMLQCLDSESRCIFILGTMFHVDSRIAGDILGLTPEAYRKRLSRIREQVSEFLKQYCGLSGGRCSCRKRVNYAIASHRVDPNCLSYTSLEEQEVMKNFVTAMEEADNLSLIFSSFPTYRTTQKARQFLSEFLRSDCYSFIENA